MWISVNYRFLDFVVFMTFFFRSHIVISLKQISIFDMWLHSTLSIQIPDVAVQGQNESQLKANSTSGLGFGQQWGQI